MRTRARFEAARLLAAAALTSAWLLLLFTGQAWGGAVHLVALAALAVFPWRALRTETAETRREEGA